MIISFTPKIYRLIFVLIYLFCFSSFLFAEDQSGIITDIEFEGLTRTKEKIARAPLEKFLGADAASLDLNDVRAAVVDTGILDPTDVQIVDNDEGGKTLFVIVQDKWAIFPVPVVFISSDNFTIGGAFFDANAFGINDKAAIAALFMNSGWLFHVMYTHSSDSGMPELGFNSGYADAVREHKDPYGNVYSRYKTRNVSLGLRISKKATENLSWQFSAGFDDVWLTGGDDDFYAPSSGRFSVFLRQGAGWRDTDWDGKLLSERSLRASYEINIGIQAEPIHTLRAGASYEKSFFPGFRFISKAGVHYSPWTPLIEESGPQAASVDILPGEFTAFNFAGMQAGLEVVVFSLKYGTLSLLSSYQIAASKSGEFGTRFDHGPSAGLRVYLRQLAIPAVGFNVSYDLASSYLKWTFSMGMSM